MKPPARCRSATWTRDVVLSFTLDIDGDRAVAWRLHAEPQDLGMVNSSWGDNVSDAVELVPAHRSRPG
jgi:hypothetical protein